MFMRISFALFIIAGLFLTGCASRDQYYWGNYENLIYAMYAKPNEAIPEQQIAKLTQDIRSARAQGKPVAPGVFAHLGYMYALSGDTTAANKAFDEEKRLFPDSVALIEGMQARAEKHRKRLDLN